MKNIFLLIKYIFQNGVDNTLNTILKSEINQMRNDNLNTEIEYLILKPESDVSKKIREDYERKTLNMMINSTILNSIRLNNKEMNKALINQNK